MGEAQTAAAALDPIFNAIADVIRIAAIFLQNFPDPTDVIVDELITEINNFLDDLRNSDMFFLPVVPKETKNIEVDFELKFSEFLDVVDASFRDQGDVQRPEFSESASVGGIVLYVGGASTTSLIDQLSVLGTVFSNVPGFAELLSRFLVSLVPDFILGFELDQNVIASTSPQTVKVTQIPTAFFEVDDEGNLIFTEDPTFPPPGRLTIKPEFRTGDIQIGDSTPVVGDDVIELTRYTAIDGNANTLTAVFRQKHDTGKGISIMETVQPGAVRLKDEVNGLQTVTSGSASVQLIRVDSTADFLRAPAVYSVGLEPFDEPVLARPIDFTQAELDTSLGDFFGVDRLNDIKVSAALGTDFAISVSQVAPLQFAVKLVDFGLVQFFAGMPIENEFMLVLNGPVRDHFVGEPVFPRGGAGQDSTHPDWTRLRVKDSVPLLAEVFDIMDRFVRAIQPSVGITSSVSLFADALESKANEISRLATVISDLVDEFDLLFLKDGVFGVNIPPAVGGVNGFMSRLRAAGDPPPFDFKGASSGGVVLLVGGPSAGQVQAAFDALVKIFDF